MIMKNSSQMMAIRERQQTNAEHRFSRYYEISSFFGFMNFAQLSGG